MALGLELKLRMGMQLVMTPQLQMAIRLLQMSSLDLADYLQEELEKNPLLEREDDGSAAAAGETAATSNTETPAQAEEKKTPEAAIETEPGESGLSDDLPVDADWNDVYSGDSFGVNSFETQAGMEGGSSG